MMAGMSAARDDIIPYGFVLGQTGALVGLNTVGMRRRGATKAQLHNIRRAYRSLFFVEGRLADRIDAVEREFADDLRVGKMIAFIRCRRKTAADASTRQAERGGRGRERVRRMRFAIASG